MKMTTMRAALAGATVAVALAASLTVVPVGRPAPAAASPSGANAPDASEIVPWTAPPAALTNAASQAPVAPAADVPVSPMAPGAKTTPNVVFILVDDATSTDFDAMPITQSLIADRGVKFTRNYSPLPVCCPARATILTGQYAHNHHVFSNTAPSGGYTVFDDRRTIASYIDDDYRTGLFGKYLNDNRLQRRYIPPGWDSFKIPVFDATYDFAGLSMWANGKIKRFPYHQQTELFAAQARSFMTSAVKAKDPFFAYVSIVAPHGGRPRQEYPGEPPHTTWVPPEYRFTAERELPDDPSINEADVSDKPDYVANKRPLSDDELAASAERSAQRIESLQAVDAEVAKTVRHLADLGVLNNTYIVVASDNGFMLGQHRIGYGKKVPYEPASRVPLVMRGPALPQGAVYNRVTGLQDLTPTFLAMTRQANDQRTARLDGLNLLGLVRGTVPPSDRVQLIEIPLHALLEERGSFSGPALPSGMLDPTKAANWRWRGFVTSQGMKYVESVRTGEVELYNLANDPYELENLSGLPRYQALLEEYADRLDRVQDCRGAKCLRAGPVR